MEYVSLAMTGIFTILKIALLPKLTSGFNAIVIKLRIFSEEIDKLTLKFLWKCKGSKTAKANKQQSWRTYTPNVKTFHKATVINTIRR